MSAPASRGDAYVLIQLGLLALIVFGPSTLGAAADWPAPWGASARAAGVVLGAFGAGLSLSGAVSLGRNLTPFPRPRAEATLVRSGPYRLVRHPIYAGLILMALGWALFENGELTLVWVAGLFLLLDAKTRHEERWLVATFGAYRDYQKRVRKLMPFLY
jgi:protein-S-isoprenylcysteine O-methyltransferase Ste14